MYGVLILKQFDGDSKIGPLGWSMFDEVNGWRVADSNYKHEIEYEFAMAYYWNIALRRAPNLGYSPNCHAHIKMFWTDVLNSHGPSNLSNRHSV